MNSVKSINLSLKYQSFTPSECKDIWIRKFVFGTKTHFFGSFVIYKIEEHKNATLDQRLKNM